MKACGWCGAPIGTRQKWCTKKCRQTAWRARRVASLEDLDDTPKRLAYADPPYPGMSKRYYGAEDSYAGEVDHRELVASLLQRYDGWALHTSSKTLRDVLPLCPPEARVASWVKPEGVPGPTRGPHCTWEPIIYMPARRRQPGFRDWIRAKNARGGGELPGRKPITVVMWVFQLLGASPGDDLDDLYPGTGVVGRCWEQFRAASSASRGDRRGGTGATSREYSSD